VNVAAPQDGPWLDDAAGRLIRPYTVSNGRTRPTTEFDLLTLVRATGAALPVHLGPEHVAALGLCDDPTSVAEIAGHLRLPAVVAKVVLSDLVDCGAVHTHAPILQHTPTDRDLLEAVLDGLRRQL
jgi:hypothetical protein